MHGPTDLRSCAIFVCQLVNQVTKKNCKGIDCFNRGEIKTKLLSWANRGTTKCTLSANGNEKPFSHDIQRTSLEDVGGLQKKAYKLQTHEGFILDRM